MAESFTEQTGASLADSLVRRLVPVADRLRDLHTKLGGRPYAVRLVRTRWTGGERGLGLEEAVSTEALLPTPLVQDLSSLAQVLHVVGLDELGDLRVSEISGRYTEDFLRGLDGDGAPPRADESLWWEIEFLRTDGKPNERRRFSLVSAPSFDSYESGGLQWSVVLRRAGEDRGRDGVPR